MNASKVIFNNASQFKVVSVDSLADSFIIYISSKNKKSFCPNCEEASSKVHSYYTRKFADLPAFGKFSQIVLRARKFYCSTLECPLKVFTERYVDHFKPYQRRTDRLHNKLLNIAIESGGKSAERICNQLSIPTSDTTLLRIIEKKELPCNNGVIALGIDDWAIKKRERYGSILADLTTNRPIGLLGDREENTLSEWLKKRTQVRIISRDRFSNYHRASTKGAPNAIQVTDRWHLLKNLGEAMRKILDREHLALKKVREANRETKTTEPRSLKSALPTAQQKKFKEVKLLLEQGVSIKEISRRFRMSRITVRKYKYLEELPKKKSSSPTGLENHLEYIKKRKAEVPEIQLKALHQELIGLGYRGAYSTLSDGLARYEMAIGNKKGDKKVLPTNLSFWRPSITSKLFFKEAKKLSKTEAHILNDLCDSSAILKQSLSFIREFRQMMLKDRSSEGLDSWISKAIISSINELRGVANGLKQDLKSIKNSFDLAWSNGPVEGNVNKLKTLKRQMYGRCSLGLLEKRLVLAPS
jgi:transposase